MRITVAAHAKINLDLRVLHRRPDGYHELRTVFQELDLHDRVTVEPTRGPFELAGDAAHMPLDATNLAWQAAAQLWRAAGRAGAPRGARVTIRKRIPSSAGLGGGSSDAAATLVALDRLWRTRLGLAGLQRAAASVGADVAFFLTGGTALGLGRGEELYPLVDLPVMPVLLVLPSFGVATGDAYGWLAEDRVAGASHAEEGVRPARTRGEPGSGAEPPWRGALPAWGNDLEAAVEARRPAIRRIRLALNRQGARMARMSGSGSAVFGLFATEREVHRAAGALAGRGWRLLVTRTRRRSPAARRRLAGR